MYEYDVPIPGNLIQEELDARGWAQRDLAFILGIEETALNKIIKGKTGISFEMSKALAQAFDVDPDFFANLQKAYDFAHAKEPDSSIARRAALQNVYPVREMIKRGWLQETDASLLEAQMTRFFRASNSTEVLTLEYAAKKTNAGEDATATQLAWLFRVFQIAESIVVPVYSEKALRDALPRLRALMVEPEEARHVPRILEECGIRFLLIEGLPGGKIDGVCCWLDTRSPVIAMSIRFDRIDNFWFVLRHEIEHVLRKHGRDNEIIDVELDRSDRTLSSEERQADEAAAEFCVPQARIDSFIVRKSPLISERDVVAFAKTVGVHPGLVVGQIQRKLDRWDFLKRYQVKVRHVLTRVALTDGWGDVAPVTL